MNTAVHLPWETKTKHLNDLCYKMFVSGYSEGFRVRAIEGGLKGYLKLLYRCDIEGRPINLPRDLNKSRMKKSKRNSWISEGSVNYGSVLFVPATDGSKLAKEIRRKEEENNQGRRTRIKVVELTGHTVRNTLAKNYPWKAQTCSLDECFLCTTNVDVTLSCRKPGVGYKISCTLCKSMGVVAEYQGESGRNLFVRGKEHLREFKDKKSTNCMVIHSRKHHGGSQDFCYKMEPTGVFQTAFDRQLDESMRLKFSGARIVMNSGSEWRGESIPRASFGPTLRVNVETDRRRDDRRNRS